MEDPREVSDDLRPKTPAALYNLMKAVGIQYKVSRSSRYSRVRSARHALAQVATAFNCPRLAGKLVNEPENGTGEARKEARR